MKSISIAIVGTRGIPNHYGGFEQCAEYLAVGLVNRGFDVTVYNSHDHPYKLDYWKGVAIVHKYDPEKSIGTAGQFIYDLSCILHTRSKKFDIILQLGYTSSSIWGWLMPKTSIITTNMDGLEWKRSKYSGLVRQFLQYAESLAIKFSDHLISDSIGIKDYLQDKYDKDSTYIAYGATAFTNPDQSILRQYEIVCYDFDILIARLEPENSIEIILDGVEKAKSERPFLVIGNHNTNFGEYLKNKFRDNPTIRFVGGIYDINVLNNLRFYSNLYFHGHTVGGTNPSLLEAMASNAIICANNNAFNKYILGDDALYFSNSDDVSNFLKTVNYKSDRYKPMIEANKTKIIDVYDWEIIVDQYAKHFREIAKCQIV